MSLHRIAKLFQAASSSTDLFIPLFVALTQLSDRTSYRGRTPPALSWIAAGSNPPPILIPEFFPLLNFISSSSKQSIRQQMKWN